MKRRGHRAYRHVIMDDVERRAQALPKDGVPREIIKLLLLDQLLEKKHQIQKSATFVSTPQSVKEAAARLDVLQWNGVVLEQRRTDEIDVNAQCNAALQHRFAKLKTSPKPISPAALEAERIEMKKRQ